MKGKKGLHCSVTMLDETIFTCSLQSQAVGEALYAEVLQSMQMFETDYFGLEYTHQDGFKTWLDREKCIHKQCLPNQDTYEFEFHVKFYTPDPTHLEDEFTRYQFALQVKQDLARGRLLCNFNTKALLVAYIAQAELGDQYTLQEEGLGASSQGAQPSASYLQGMAYVPDESEELNMKIMEFHGTMRGISPADADASLLDTARKTDLYGIVFHPARDHEGVDLDLAVVDSGILVFQNNQRINTFSWAKIRKLSFKRIKFIVKLQPSEDHGYHKNMVAFHMSTRNESKHFWKVCVEHHSFFRATSAPATIPRPRRRRVSFQRGSSFRYTGRTQKQLLDHVKDNFVKPTRFERTLSSRASSRRQLAASSASTTLTSHHRAMGGSMEAGSSLSSGSHMIASTSLASAHTTTGAVYAGGGTEGPRASMTSFGSPGKKSPPVTPSHELSRSSGQGSREQIIAEPVVHIDRNVSEPVLSTAEGWRAKPETHRLARAPDYHNIPGNMDNQEEVLSRAPEVGNIPEEVEEDINSEPRSIIPASQIPNNSYTDTENTMNASHGVVRIHSETDTSDSRNNPRDLTVGSNGAVPGGRVDSQELLAEPTPPLYDGPSASPPPVHQSAQFALGSSDLITNGNSDPSVTIPAAAESSARRKTDANPLGTRPRPHSSEKSYHISKELVMTERAYHKDLEGIVKWFRQAVTVVFEDSVVAVMESLFSYIEPVFQAHVAFLDDCEVRLTQWEGKASGESSTAVRRIGDILVEHFDSLEVYKNYVVNLVGLMLDLTACMDKFKEFTKIIREFESEKVCYLPLYCILLKPAHRLQHYELLLSRLITYYQMSHYDYADCKTAYAKITGLLGSLRAAIAELENTEKVLEIQQDIVGLEGLVQSGRYFMREGCLQKMSRNGFQQRLFLLMSDVLVYTSRTSNTQLQFKIHGQMAIEGMTLEENESEVSVANSFTIYNGNRCLIVAASSQEEKSKWVEDIMVAIRAANLDGAEDDPSFTRTLPQIVKPAGSSTSVDAEYDSSSLPSDKQIAHRANTTMHVCWHRNTSVSMRDIQNAVKYQLSGYLLRKFKNSSGWQKLWVVFTNFCLFFYKSYQDDYPLASLPLLGYSVSKPSASDGISKDFVFKLQFKNHVYFFRAESEYIYDRWVEVINSATRGSHRTRMFSRMDSMQ